ncbi:MAG: helix-turn-helix domain-containing protein [Gammaproteobacteria bacterium]
MKKEKTLGETLISAIQEAIDAPGAGRVVRPKIDIKSLRHKLHLTQKEFSKRYHLNLETLRNWEQGERSPDATGIAYLTCITKNPEIISTLLNQHK